VSRDWDAKSSIRRLVHCPVGAEALTLLETTLTVLLAVTVTSLLVETEEDTLFEAFTLLLVAEETVERLVDGGLTVLVTIEELLELLLVKEIVLPTLLDLTLAHTSCVSPISQAPLILNDSKTILSMAFKFAPENALNGTVYV
jgi:hypothetical protein